MSYNYSHANIKLVFTSLFWTNLVTNLPGSVWEWGTTGARGDQSSRVQVASTQLSFLKEEIAIFLKVWFWFEGTNYLFNTIVHFWKIPNHSIASCDLTLEMKNYNSFHSKVLIWMDQLFLRIFLRSKFSLTIKRIYMYSLYCRRISRRLQHNFPLFGRFLRNKSTSASDVK